MFIGPAYGMWAGLHLLSSLFTILLIALLITLLVRAFAKRGPRWPGHYYYQQPGFPPPPPGPGPRHFEPQPQPSAMEILRQRYARGEIDATTFDQMRERLEASERPHQGAS